MSTLHPLHAPVDSDHPSTGRIRLSTPAPWHLRVVALLESRGYPEFAAEHVVEHLAIHGIADVGPALLDPDDRPDVERIIAREGLRWCGRTDCEAVADDDPYSYQTKRWESDLAFFLLGREYTKEAVAHVIRHANEDGSIECCNMLHEEDRAEAESILPTAPIGNWARYDGFVWMSND
jgi:hypothetical protein